MKKIISALLAMVMLLSGVCVMNASAASYPDDITAAYENGTFNGVDTLFAPNGTTNEIAVAIEKLYNPSGSFFWDGMDVTSGDVALALANVDTYLKKMINQKYGGGRLYYDATADQYATAIARFLYRLLYDFNASDAKIESINVTFEGTQAVQEVEFFTKIAEVSGFAALLQNNWCDAGVDFINLMELFGLSKNDLLPSDYKTGSQLGAKILLYAVSKIINFGPLTYMFDILTAFASGYTVYYQNAFEALFKIRINNLQGAVTVEDLSTLTGILNLVFNNCLVDVKDSSKYVQFLTLPEKAIQLSTSNSEARLYLMTYFALNAKYANNEKLVSNYYSDFLSLLTSSNTTAEDIGVVNGFYHGFFMGKYKDNTGAEVSSAAEFISSYKAMYQATLDGTSDNLLQAFYNSIAKIFRSIAEIIDNWIKIFSGEKEFGK